MKTATMAIDAARNSSGAMTHTGVRAALEKLHQRSLGDALGIFAFVFKDGIGLPAEQVASVMIEVTDALITVFELDEQASAAYFFFRTVGAKAASVIAGLLELANFPKGDEDPATLNEPIMLTYAGALSAAGRHDDAINILTRLFVKSPDGSPRLNHAMLVAQRRKDGLSDI